MPKYQVRQTGTNAPKLRIKDGCSHDEVQPRNRRERRALDVINRRAAKAAAKDAS